MGAPVSGHHDPTQTNRDDGSAAFDALVDARMRQPFVWGQHDCVLFAADAVAALTGRDHAVAVRGTYHTEDQASEVLAGMGGLPGCAALAGPPCEPLTAARGDIGLVFDGSREMLGVCVGPHWLVPGKYGLSAQPLRAARLAWRTARG